MNKRERNLAIAVGLGLLALVGSQFLPEDFLSAEGFAGGDLDSARRTFRDYREWVERGPQIRADYRRVESQLPETQGVQTPESTFTNQLAELLRERDWNIPNLGAPKRSTIKDIEDYEYIDLQFSISGEPQRVITLLTDLQNAGLLIKSFGIRHMKTTDLHINMDVVVSRLVKLTEEEKRRQSDRRRR